MTLVKIEGNKVYRHLPSEFRDDEKQDFFNLEDEGCILLLNCSQEKEADNFYIEIADIPITPPGVWGAKISLENCSDYKVLKSCEIDKSQYRKGHVGIQI